MELWFLYAVGSVVFLATFSLFTKKLFTRGFDPLLYGGAMQFTVGVMAIPLVLIYGFSFDVSFKTVTILLVSGFVYAAAASLNYYGLSKTELSRAAILTSTAAIWGMVSGFVFLGEPFTSQKILAIVCIISAILLIEGKNNNLKFAKYDLFILASAIFYAVGASLDNILVSHSDPFSYLMVSFLTAGTTMLLMHSRHNAAIVRSTARQKDFIKMLMLNSFFILLSYAMIFSAYEADGEVSEVYAIEQLETVLTAFLGILILREFTRLPYKLIAAMLAFAGLMMLKK